VLEWVSRRVRRIVDELGVDAADEDVDLVSGQLEVPDPHGRVRRSRSGQDADRSHDRPPRGGPKCAIELLELDDDRLARGAHREPKAEQECSAIVEPGALDVEGKVSREDPVRPDLVSPTAESAGAADEVTRRRLTEPRQG
jgi:hypothetical protein